MSSSQLATLLSLSAANTESLRLATAVMVPPLDGATHNRWQNHYKIHWNRNTELLDLKG